MTADGAAVAELVRSTVSDPDTAQGSTYSVMRAGTDAVGRISLVENATSDGPIIVSGNAVCGILSRRENRPAVIDEDSVNAVKSSSCAGL